MSARGPRNRPRKPRSYRVRVSALRASLIGSRSCRTQQLLLSFNHSHTRGHPESTHVAAPRACCQLLLARELSAGRSFGSPPSSRFTSIRLSYLTSFLYARRPLCRCPTGPQLKKAPPPLPPPARRVCSTPRHHAVQEAERTRDVGDCCAAARTPAQLPLVSQGG